MRKRRGGRGEKSSRTEWNYEIFNKRQQEQLKECTEGNKVPEYLN